MLKDNKTGIDRFQDWPQPYIKYKLYIALKTPKYNVTKIDGWMNQLVKGLLIAICIKFHWNGW